LYIVASAAVPKYNLFLIIELIAWMSPKQAPTNYIISIYIVIYDVSQCANIWLDFQLRETTLFKARLRHIEGCDLAQFGSICLMSILPGLYRLTNPLKPEAMKKCDIAPPQGLFTLLNHWLIMYRWQRWTSYSRGMVLLGVYLPLKYHMQIIYRI